MAGPSPSGGLVHGFIDEIVPLLGIGVTVVGFVGSSMALSLTRHVGAPGRNRTCAQRIRRPLLYPLSYGGHA